MYSKVSICNLALSFLGCNSISSIDENSTEAVACRMHYDTARQTSLQAHDWDFARKTITLAIVSGAPEHPLWSYTYMYPTDCLQPRQILNVYNKKKIKYEIVGSGDGNNKYILTNEEGAILKYTKNVTNETMFDSMYARALSALLAVEMCQRLTGSTDRNKVLWEVYRQAMISAQVANANSDNDPNEDIADTFIQARR